jgi:hypothetical protein
MQHGINNDVTSVQLYGGSLLTRRLLEHGDER